MAFRLDELLKLKQENLDSNKFYEHFSFCSSRTFLIHPLISSFILCYRFQIQLMQELNFKSL